MNLSLVNLLGTIVVAVTFVMGQESFTRMATQQALDLRELKYILWGVAF